MDTLSYYQTAIEILNKNFPNSYRGLEFKTELKYSSSKWECFVLSENGTLICGESNHPIDAVNAMLEAYKELKF